MVIGFPQPEIAIRVPDDISEDQRLVLRVLVDGTSAFFRESLLGNLPDGAELVE